MKERLFRDILPRVAKPARYTGGELNMIKKDWEQAGVKMAFAFPDVYEVGMSHLGGKILYGVVNEKSQHLLERVFAPWPDMEAIMRSEQLPLFSLESFRPVTDFEVLGFSLQYELSITNVLNMLDLAGIPVWSSARNDAHPLIIAGGPVAFNPEPFAEFFDIFIIGDGEEVLPELLDEMQAVRGWGKTEKLRRLALIEGIYAPALYRVEYKEDGTLKSFKPGFAGVPPRVCKRVVQDLDQAYYPEKPLLPYMEIAHDRAVLEVMRGCQRGCRFCHAGIVYRPVRERSREVLEDQARRQLRNTGYEEISLASLSSLDYSGIDPLVKALVRNYGDKGIGVSLPSLRVDAFSIDLANEVRKVRKTTLTLAPEAGTQCLRDIINKNVSEKQLLEAAEAAFKSGWLSLKLYFMIGLPGEKEEDLEGIIALLQKVKYIGDQYSKRPAEIRVSLASFVPKAHTPFQWRVQDSMEELDNKRQLLMRRKRKRIKLSFHDSRTSYLEGIIARGDRRLAPMLYLAWQKGCKFDAWSEYFNFDRWQEAIQESLIDSSFYTRRLRPYEELLPWDFIDIGVSKEFLQEEDRKAEEGLLTADCRQEGCNDCGICLTTEVSLDIKGGSVNALEM